MTDKRIFKKKGKVTIRGGGFVKKPKLIRIFGKWYPVGEEEWKLLRSLELDEIKLKKKPKLKKVM
jgi:hypothetical protein